ncbi:MAG: PhzF family phenazine biosynthesis protein [Algoriphagus sp.]|uniref:PhzF family phenazine biosynthesis protein n=1 Tax=Algoriphagus sp. TaxID=1872435 RepID=UPI00179D49F0|nr:PhzF family phenazine biosynthesis protein [Algoriphagus sp.]NVJ85535.1 PhzF family phenazine biosynthesis protein [Algoriphagus sp.]
MKLTLGVVDAFTSRPFAGNPAAVCLLEEPIDAQLMQQIAMEMNLSETAFVERGDQVGHFKLRWFTPTLEIDLCGHATLATSRWMLHRNWATENSTIHFHTKSGELIVRADGTKLEMNFPLIPTFEDKHPAYQEFLFGKRIVKAAQLRKNWIFQLENEQAVRSLEPDFMEIAKNSEEGFIITSKGEKYDIVSRFFGPNVGVPEDPVTGFAHCALMDYWNQEEGKMKLHAFQASRRGGEMWLEKHDDRVLIVGEAVVVYQAEMNLNL